VTRRPIPSPALALLVALAAAPAVSTGGCATKETPPKEPLGYLPTAVTTAQPEWLPFAIRAGRSFDADPREHHLADLRQITYAQGENAEGYWSPDGRSLIFQSTRDGAACDQMFVMDLGGGETRRVSNGQGRTTCGFFFYPRGDRILYSQTPGAACPPKPDRSQGYTWGLDDFNIFEAKPDGSDRKPLLVGPGYNAEATVAFDGSRMVFTSTRDGDLELYTARLDGTDVRRITHTPGYDGGATFSPDSSKLVWRASRPTGEALEEYRELLTKGLVRPTQLEIMVSGSEGQHARAVTNNKHANFAPAFLPDSRRVIFASNLDADPAAKGLPNFDLYVVDPEGPVTITGMPATERITFHEGFDSFPMFSPDGRYLAFVSSRGGSKPGELNLFIARWVD
jgi:TolB protein